MLRAATVALRDGSEGRVVGVAKGASMIEPNMATLLVFLLTDVEAARDDLRRDLSRAVVESFIGAAWLFAVTAVFAVLFLRIGRRERPSAGGAT